MKTKIITLVDNITYKQGLKAEHGLSFLLKIDSIHILFDTGQSNLFIDNATILGEDLQKITHVVISHGHYDHTGGLKAFMELNAHARIWIHSKALDAKFSIATGQSRFIGIGTDLTGFMHRFSFVDIPTEICDNVWLLPRIEQYTSYETLNANLLCGTAEAPVPDPFDDELVMYIRHPHGVTLVSGCAHRGIVNAVEAVKAHSGQDTFKLIIGGTHLNGAPLHRIKATSAALKGTHIESFMPNHCTGIAAYSHLSANLDCHVSYAQTGTVVCVE
ncbi:MAG: MBL fold metallo-hydrolase [Breznakibacter sp.]